MKNYHHQVSKEQPMPDERVVKKKCNFIVFEFAADCRRWIYRRENTTCFRQSSTRYVGPRSDVRTWSNPVGYVHGPISPYCGSKRDQASEKSNVYTRNAVKTKTEIRVRIQISEEWKGTEKESRRGTQEPANESAVRQIEGEDSSSSALLLLRDVVYTDSSLAILLPELFATMIRIFPTV